MPAAEVLSKRSERGLAGPGHAAPSPQLPMVLKVPRLNASPLALCDRPFSLLGFGDILVPGTWVPLGVSGHRGWWAEAELSQWGLGAREVVPRRRCPSRTVPRVPLRAPPHTRRPLSWGLRSLEVWLPARSRGWRRASSLLSWEERTVPPGEPPVPGWGCGPASAHGLSPTGLLVAYCHRFDIQVQSSRVYFVACTIGKPAAPGARPCPVLCRGVVGDRPVPASQASLSLSTVVVVSLFFGLLCLSLFSSVFCFLCY